VSRTRQPLVWQPERRPGCVRCLSYDYPSGHVVPPHVHEWHQLVYAVRGVMTVSTETGSWIVPPHRAVWMPAKVEHAIRMSGPVSMRTLYVAPRTARDLPRDCCTVDVPALLREVVLHTLELGSLDPRIPAQRNLLAVLLDQIRALRSTGMHLPRPADARARRVAMRLEEAPSERRTLGALARGSGASTRTLQRVFRAETGMSFGTWRQQLRLGHALQALAAGGSVTSVAFDAGYASVSAFVSAFRRTFGQPPARYLRRPTLSTRTTTHPAMRS
jgi:AraC-like DNA-binding protein